MPMLISDDAESAGRELAAQSPYQGESPGAGEAFSAGYRSLHEGKNANVREATRQDIQNEYIRRFYQASGQSLRPWLGGAGVNPIEDRELSARNQVDTYLRDNPDADLPSLPTNDEIEAEWQRRASTVIKETDDVSARTEGILPNVAGFAGMAAGAMTDPINFISLPIGAGRAAGVLGTAMWEGAVNLFTESAIQGINYSSRKKIDANYSAGDAVKEVAAAGAGGAVLGGGLKGLANVWSRVATGEWPSHVRDAANVVSREASTPASRFQRSAAGDQANRAAFAKASDDLVRGRPVELPPEAFIEANVRPNRVYDADGNSVGVRYEIAEAEDLITSHRDDLSVNKAFPPELQPRDRSRAISQDQVTGIAANLQPERLGFSNDAGGGAPIVGPDGLVESGNGRTLALRRAYQQGGPQAESYRNYLRSQNFDLDGFQNPILIARRMTDLEDEARVGFVTAANRSTVMRLGAAEQAMSDARLLDAELLGRMDGSDVGSSSNSNFVRGFMSNLPRAEQASLVDAQGRLSQEGGRRITSALMGRAYGDAALLGRALEDSDNNIKTIAGAMADASTPWAKMRDAVARGEIPAGMDLTEDLMNAVKTVMRARDEGRPVSELINQGEMFGGPDELSKLVARAMFTEDMKRPLGRARLRDFLSSYADEASKNSAGPRLFGDPLRPEEVLKTSLDKSGREDLKRLAEENLTPEAIEKTRTSPDLDDAIIQEANRIRAEKPELLVDLGDGDESLDAIFDRADEELFAAKQIESCATGFEVAAE